MHILSCWFLKTIPLLVTAISACASAALPASDTTAPLNPPTYFGINGIGFLHGPENDKDHLYRRDLLRELGVKWDRSDLWWSTVEPSPGKWDFSVTDKAMRFYRDNNLQMFPILCYGAVWNHSDGPANAEQLIEWQRYVEKVMGRYGQYCDTWEVWNEPNILPFWRPQPDAEHYAELLQATYKTAKRVQPSCKVIGFTLADFDKKFLERVIARSGVDCFDKVSYHFYRTSRPEDDTPREIRELKLILDHYGKQCPLWVTEMGVTSYTGHEGVTEDLQAIFWMRQIILLIAGGVERIFPFCLVDSLGDPAGAWGNHLGMVTLDGRRKPVFYAYKTMIAELQDYEFEGEVNLGENIMAFLFRSRNADPANVPWKLAAWSTKDSVDIRVPVDLPVYGVDKDKKQSSQLPENLTTYTTLLGERKRVDFDGDSQRVMLSSSLIYLPVNSQQIRDNAATGFAPSAMMVSPGERLPLPAMRMPVGDEVSSRVRVMGEKQGDHGRAISVKQGVIEVASDAAHGWYTIELIVDTPRGAVVKNLHLWVRPAVEVSVRPTAAPEAASLRILSETRNVAAKNPPRVTFSAEPPIPGLADWTLAPTQSSNSTSKTKSSRHEFDLPLSSLQKVDTGFTIYATVMGAAGIVSRLPGFRFAVIPRTSRMVTIDGNLEEFTGAPEMKLDDKAQLQGDTSLRTFYDPAQHSATVRALWAEEGLYVAAEIMDDVPMLNPNAPGQYIYNGDELEIYIGVHGYHGEYYAKPEKGFYHFALSPGMSGTKAVVSDFATSVSGSRIVAIPQTGGYAMEAFIPIAAMGNKPSAKGSAIAWDVQLNDRDDSEPGAPLSSLMWNGDGENWLKAGKWGMAVIKDETLPTP